MSDTATDKPEVKELDLVWGLADGTPSEVKACIEMLWWWVMMLFGWLGCFTAFGLKPATVRALISILVLLGVWAALCVRKVPKR